MNKLMKLLVLQVILFFSQTQIYCQCPTSFVFQTQIDSFILNYPSCDSLSELDLSSFSFDPIKNLDGLINIKYIGNSVDLAHLDSLSDISGLDNVERINGNLFIGYLESLNVLNGFKNLKEINGSLTFQGTNFDSIVGFGALQKIDHVLAVTYNSNLKKIKPLGSLDSFYRILIYNNLMLEELNFLNSVSTITEQVSINGNYSISNLDGLENLRSAEYIIIENNILLNSISALQNLERLGSTSLSFLRIKSNPKLTSLSGLENLDISTVSELILSNNQLLSYCHLENICDYVSSPFNNATVIGNDTDCDTRQNLVDKCSSSFNLSEGILDQCAEISTINISENNSNNSKLLHIYDDFNNLLCSINAQGNDLGTTVFDLYNSSEVRMANVPYANRDFTITPENQPSSDVLVRFYYTDEDIGSMIQNDDTVNSINDLIISKNQSNCTGSISEMNELISPFSFGITLDNIFFLDINVQEFSTFFAHGPHQIFLSSPENIRQDLVVFPNPTSDNLYISELNNYSLELYNIYGDIINIDTERINKNELDVSYLSAGLYILNIKSGNIKQSIKFIKM